MPDVGKRVENIPRIPEKFNELTIWNTAMCNLRCKYCFVYKLYPNQPMKNMSDEVISKLPEFLKKYFNPNPNVYFFGGEPMFSFDTIKKIYYTVKKEIPNATFGLTTNLTLIDEEKAMWLGKHNFSVLCSIDGRQKSHDMFRVKPDGTGSWEEAWKGLLNVRKYINPNPQIRWTVNPETVDTLYDDVMFYIEHGFTNLAIDPVYEVKWSEERINKYMDELEKIAKYIVNVSYPIFLKPFQDMMPLVGGMKTNWMFRCGLAQGGIGMDIFGRVFACHRFVATGKEELVLGDVFKGIDEKKRLEWNETYWKGGKPYNVSNPERCETCPVRDICMGGCLAVNYDVNGKLNAVPDSYCDIENAKVKRLMPYILMLKNKFGNAMQPRC
jgi:uncharacterized protein